MAEPVRDDVPAPAPDPRADYRVRIFTPGGELPFAGHPTLGSCHVWLATGAVPREDGVVVQQCGVGLVRVRREGPLLAFGAPSLIRAGAVDTGVRTRVLEALGLAETQVREVSWTDNGPGWVSVLVRDARSVLDLRPDLAAMGDLAVGVVGPHPGGSECRFEVRAFAPGHGIAEDPVTGSLNAGLAQWLIGSGHAPDSYVVSQGTALGRSGRVHVTRDDDGIWIGGAVTPVVQGSVTL